MNLFSTKMYDGSGCKAGDTVIVRTNGYKPVFRDGDKAVIQKVFKGGEMVDIFGEDFPSQAGYLLKHEEFPDGLFVRFDECEKSE